MAKNSKADMSCARVKKYTSSDVSKAESVLVKLFGNTLFGNHALYRNSIGVI